MGGAASYSALTTSIFNVEQIFVFELPGIERSLKAGHQSRSQPPAPPLRRAPFRCRQNLLLDTPLGQPEYEGRGIGPRGQNRQNRADTGGKRRNRPCTVRRRMAAVQP